MELIFWCSLILIFHTFIGFPLSLEILKRMKKIQKVNKNKDYEPKISFVIAAHNEEKVIEKKLENVISLNYPKNKMEIIVASDNSNDNTNKIILNFISNHKELDIKLYEVKERKGKTNAQNEAVRISTGEILVFSDANSMWKVDAIRKLIDNFSDEKIDYVCGKLEYVNSLDNLTSSAESTYWNYDLRMRKIESDISSITAGNGAIYAIRKIDFIEIDPIDCHDGLYPTLSVLNKKRAIFEEEAIAFEKAGETTGDEFSRKVRMGRALLKSQYSNLEKYNPLKTGIFSYLFFCHRYLRYSLYMLHILAFVSNILIFNQNIIYKFSMVVQVLFYLLAITGYITKIKNKIFYFPMYYTMTILAQLIAVKKTILKQNKPFWEKAETTR